MGHTPSSKTNYGYLESNPRTRDAQDQRPNTDQLPHGARDRSTWSNSTCSALPIRRSKAPKGVPWRQGTGGAIDSARAEPRPQEVPASGCGHCALATTARQSLSRGRRAHACPPRRCNLLNSLVGRQSVSCTPARHPPIHRPAKRRRHRRIDEKPPHRRWPVEECAWPRARPDRTPRTVRA